MGIGVEPGTERLPLAPSLAAHQVWITMALARSLLLAAAGSDTLNRLATRNPVVRRATRAFMPGEDARDALEAAAALVGDGRRILFTRLGEAISSAAEADAVRDHYLALFDEVAEAGLPAEISVKPTQLGLEVSEDRCLALARSLARRASETGSVLWLDMEDATTVDRTLTLYEALKADVPETGLALQAYLYRTPEDLERLAPLEPVVRLVKGAYAEPAHLAYPAKADTDGAYEALAGQMLDLVARRGGATRAVMGTHDLALLGRIDARAGALGLGREDWEIHMLYGIRAGDQSRLRTEGHGVATLISYGEAWYRWYMRRLAERPANVWFVARSILG